MIVELDCGNSFIKWRIITGLSACIVSTGIVESDEELISELEYQQGRNSLRHCRLVSVRSDEETSRLCALLAQRLGLELYCAQPARYMAGVHNGYIEFRSLGLDRWLAVIGAFNLAGKACLVLDLGTAITSDLVSVNGEHKGGYICPGLSLLHSQLRNHTRRIRYDEDTAEVALKNMEPGRTTAEAVERGCLLMLQGFVAMQVELASEYLGEDFEVFLTGGDAALVKGMLPNARFVPDLIFVGLAIACPIN